MSPAVITESIPVETNTSEDSIHAASAECAAIMQCIEARLARLRSLCSPEAWRLIMECEQHHQAHIFELARQSYWRGRLDAGMVSGTQAHN